MKRPPPLKLVGLLTALAVVLAAKVHLGAASRQPIEPPDAFASALVHFASSVRQVLPGMEHTELLKRPDLHDRTPSEASVRLGMPPTSTVEVKLGEPQPEFRVELYNFFPPDDPATTNVVVLEEVWVFTGYSIAVWYRRDHDSWRSFDSLEWPDDVVF